MQNFPLKIKSIKKINKSSEHWLVRWFVLRRINPFRAIFLSKLKVNRPKAHQLQLVSPSYSCATVCLLLKPDPNISLFYFFFASFFIFTLCFVGIVKSCRIQALLFILFYLFYFILFIFLFINARSDLLVVIRWSIWFPKFPRRFRRVVL